MTRPRFVRVRTAVATAFLGVSLTGLQAVTARALPDPVPCDGCWTAAPATSWQWQLQGRIDTGVDVQMYDVDGFEAPGSVIRTLHGDGRAVVCYLSAGSWEDFRPDARDFPDSVLGRSNGWPGERWLDIRRLRVLKPIMRERIQMCADKKFDGIEFDNVDGYENTTGFPLRGRDQLRYNVWLANAAHRAGLSAALKNDVGQVPDARAVLRLRARRGVLHVRRVQQAHPVRGRRQGGLRRRVRARALGILPGRRGARVRLHEEEAQPARLAAPLSVTSARPVRSADRRPEEQPMTDAFDPRIRAVHLDDPLEWEVIPTEPGDPNEPGEETVLFRSGDARFSFGMWRRAPEEGPMEPPYHEIAVIIEGEVEVTEADGTTHRVGPGDVLITPNGSKATWKALSPVKKFWAVYKE